ncbi:MAG: SufE family protein [Chlamydiales bacterium]|nr:SufE family protein [Chlamydiales bacterium]
MNLQLMYESCLKKQDGIKKKFFHLETPEEKYNLIMDLGKNQAKLDPSLKTEESLVKGCQSKMYLRSYLKDGLVYFETESDALISAGLAVLLTEVYSGEKPEVILKCPPTYLEEIGITSSLSPSRSNGLASLHLKMKQEALRYIHKQA